MKTRIITAIVALAIFVPVVIFAGVEVFAGVKILNLALALLAGVGALEAVKCTGEKNSIVICPSITVSAFLLLITNTTIDIYAGVFIILLFVLLFVGVLMNKSLSCDKLLVSFALTFYVTVSFGSMAVLYNTAVRLFPLIFIGAWVTDTFAYFTGFFFGKHKLIPEVSPKKTVEGAVGGTLATTITFGIYAWCMTKSISTALTLTAIGFFASIISQLGDLSASLIKRHWGIKDYGKLFPGHGGVLDRFDSILAVSVFLFAISNFITV